MHHGLNDMGHVRKTGHAVIPDMASSVNLFNEKGGASLLTPNLKSLH